jgi:hypothetical protein
MASGKCREGYRVTALINGLQDHFLIFQRVEGLEAIREVLNVRGSCGTQRKIPRPICHFQEFILGSHDTVKDKKKPPHDKWVQMGATACQGM